VVLFFREKTYGHCAFCAPNSRVQDCTVLFLKRQFFVSASQLIVRVLVACAFRLFHALFITCCCRLGITPSLEQFCKVIIATNVARLTCKDFFKQLLRAGVVAGFYVFQRQRMLHETVVRILPQKIF
jgi:hypothetical protein